MFRDEYARLLRIKPQLERRALILNGVRAYFCQNGFLEVETPLRVPAVAPEEYIMPYTSEGWFLSTSPELQMKRLLAAGFEKIFQISHCFRKGERGKQHNPEFTMIEWYRSGADYRQLIRDTEQLVLVLCCQMGTGSILNFQGRRIDLSPPWPEVTVKEAYLRWAGWDPVSSYNGERFDDDMANKIIPSFVSDSPTVILDYPRECASLARLKPGDPLVAERVEIFIGGVEIANGFSELVDPVEQERRFKMEMARMQKAGKPAVLPLKFLEAIKQMPESAGIALGIDRLVMLLCDASSIDEVMAFPADLL